MGHLEKISFAIDLEKISLIDNVRCLLFQMVKPRKENRSTTKVLRPLETKLEQSDDWYNTTGY